MTRLIVVATVVIGVVGAAIGLDVWLSPVAAQTRAASNALPRADRLGDGVKADLASLGQLLTGSEKTTPSGEKKRRLHAMAQTMRAIDALIPRDSFDVAAVVAHVGRDTAAIAQWVRDHTQLVPYRGLLRGATGVLMDRTGNSLDRSLLLAGLLKESGKISRLARARLTPDQAKALQSSSAPLKDAEPADWQNKINAAIDTYATNIGIAGGQVRDHLQKTLGLAREANDTLQRRVKIQTDRLMKAIGPPVSSGGDGAAADVEALRDHWWVQVQDGGAWKDVDPSSPDTAKPIVVAQQTFAPDAIPPDLQATVQVRLIVEKTEGTKVEEHRAVALDVRPADVLGQTIRLQHVPLQWPRDLLPPTPDQMQRVGDAALNQHEWLPIFSIGKKVVGESSILDTGDLNKKPDPKAAAVQTFIDALGGSDAAPVGMLTAEWIEYEIRSPGQPARTIRREVFDLVGPAARAAHEYPASLSDDARVSRALSLMNETEILIESAQLNAAFITHLTASGFVADEPVITALIDDSSLTSEALADRVKGLTPLPGILQAFASARAIAGPAAPGYLSRPNILSSHTFLKEDPPGSLAIVGALDIVANEISVSQPNTFASRVAQGVTDANLEAMLLGSHTNGNVSDQFGVGDGGDDWIALRTEADVRRLPAPPDLRARIEAEVRAGFVVIAPRTAQTGNDAGGWWRIDPNTGDTLSMGDRGWGQAQVETIFNNVLAGGALLASACLLGFAFTGKMTGQRIAGCLLFGGAAATGGLFWSLLGALALGLASLVVVDAFLFAYLMAGFF